MLALPYEIWRDVKWYEGRYLVSSLWNMYTFLQNKIMKPCLSSNWYFTIYLRKDWRRICMRIHRLVALSFLGESNKKCVNHIDGNKLNNSLDNLERATHTENLIHAYDKLWRKWSMTWLFGEKHPNSKKILVLKNGVYILNFYRL